MPANNHPADQTAIEALHSRLAENISDRLIALQDEAYAMGRARGRQDGPVWISASERLPEVKEGDEQEVIVCVRRAHNGQSYVFSARYLNQFALYTEGHPDADENGCLISTGWHDVKEHSEYDGWYSPLIAVEGDEVTHWMPLPAAPGVPA
ncbi:DUF551 domain-containing protein [Pseudomonas sp. B1-22]|uniref:DUF551 domain-containing protein n=1 Tax=Pseudomonas sp. B1-22 TaxID=3141456 RepID=UPI003D2A6B6C